MKRVQLVAFVAGCLALTLGTLQGQNPPPATDGLVWDEYMGKKCPFTFAIGTTYYISAHGKLDTTKYMTPKVIEFDNAVLFMKVTKVGGDGNPVPGSDVYFQGSQSDRSYAVDRFRSCAILRRTLVLRV